MTAREPGGAVRVAFQGEPGAFSQEAATAFFGDESVETLPCATFREVFAAVSDSRCERGVVPIENSFTGSVLRNYDLLLDHELFVVGEHFLPVRHCLIVRPGTRLEDVERVLSHPQALAQCRESLDRLLPGRERVPTADTAGSVALLEDEGRGGAAALAGRRAAEVYGMEILAEDLQDASHNRTRFVVLAREPAVSTGERPKTSVVFAVPNRPGALHGALEPFARRKVDLTKLESRPAGGSPWEYVFYLDLAGAADRGRCAEALRELEEMATLFRVLGSYPRAGTGRAGIGGSPGGG